MFCEFLLAVDQKASRAGPKWEARRPQKNLPSQRNGFDCGIFVCHYVEQLQKGGSMNFTHTDMERKRNAIRLSIIRGKLI
jgi:Ulp1 family protease